MDIEITAEPLTVKKGDIISYSVKLSQAPSAAEIEILPGIEKFPDSPIVPDTASVIVDKEKYDAVFEDGILKLNTSGDALIEFCGEAIYNFEQSTTGVIVTNNSGEEYYDQVILHGQAMPVGLIITCLLLISGLSAFLRKLI